MKRGSAFVTGAAQGIGKSIVKALSQAGFRVLAFDVDQASLSVLDEGQKGVFLGDVSDPASIHAGIEAACRLAPLTLCVNNAGIIGRTPILMSEEKEVRRIMEVNLLGCFWGIQSAGRKMVAQRNGGHIINLSSGHAVLAGFDRAAYAATKAGIEALTRNAALELGHEGICVNAIAPGFTLSEMSKGSLVGDRRKTVERRLPLGRVGVPEEVASAVVALATGAISGMTGQVLRIDGGWSNSDVRYSDLKVPE